MPSVRKLRFIAANDRYNTLIREKHETWEQFVSRFVDPPSRGLSLSEVKALSKPDLEAAKDTGWYSPGIFAPVLERKNQYLQARTMVTLDADNCEPWDTAETLAESMSQSLGCSVLAHTTFSHTPDAPRIRMVIPLKQDVRPGVYEPLSRYVAEKIGIECVDTTTHQGARAMFWPTRILDVEYEHHVAGEGMFDAKAFLSNIDGWKKYQNWPRAKSEGAPRKTQTKAEDPTQKPNPIGKFCRAFSIPEAIERFELPYEPVGNRFRYTEGEGLPGGVWYEADHAFYSHHATDPANGYTNAWDLVRIHKFGDKDKGIDENTPIHERPSHGTMEIMVSDLPEMQDSPGEQDKEENEESIYDLVLAKIDKAKPVAVSDAANFVANIAAARVSEAERASLIKTLNDACDPKPGTVALKKDVQKAQKQQRGEIAASVDVDRILIEALLSERYAEGKHLRRYAKQFWRYSEGVWRITSDEVVRGSLQEQVSLMRAQETDDLDSELVQLLEEKSTATIMTARWAMMQAHVAHMYDEDDPLGLMKLDIEPVMNFRNGELRFSDDGKPRLYAHNPEHMLTEQLAIDYNPKADTTAWDNFMDVLFGDKEEPEEMRRHFEEFCGYVIQPWRGLAAFGLIMSPPNSGKTTFGNVLHGLLANSMVSREITRYDKSDSHDTAGLVGKLLLLDDDYEANGMLPDGFLKKVSEAKPITANPKNAAQYTFVCRAIPLIFSNHWPGMRDHSGGVRRRALVWEFDPIPPFIRNVKEGQSVWTKGLQGAALRFVQGFGRLWARQEWQRPQECEDSLSKWMNKANTVATWKEDRLRQGQKVFLKQAATFPDYKEWYRSTFPRFNHYGQHQFLENLRGLMGQPVKSNGIWGWHGWELKPQETVENLITNE